MSEIQHNYISNSGFSMHICQHIHIVCQNKLTWIHWILVSFMMHLKSSSYLPHIISYSQLKRSRPSILLYTTAHVCCRRLFFCPLCFMILDYNVHVVARQTIRISQYVLCSYGVTIWLNGFIIESINYIICVCLLDKQTVPSFVR